MWHAGRNRRNHVSLHSNHPIIFSDQTHKEIEMQIQIRKSLCVQRHAIHTNKCNADRKRRNHVSHHINHPIIFSDETHKHIQMQIQIQIQIPICLQRHTIRTNKCHAGRKRRNRVSLHFYKCNYKVYNTALVFARRSH